MQVKKKSVHDAILRGAARLFSSRGYHRTTLADIARSAGVGVGNVYSYFPSKLVILYLVYRPWLSARIEELEAALRRIDEPRRKLRCLLYGLWHDIPAQNTGLANSLMEALATADPQDGKPDDLLRWTEAKLTALLRDAVPAERRHLLDGDLLSHLLLMAFDGFVINRRLGDMRDIERLTNVVCDVILGSATMPRAQPARPRRIARQGRRSRKTA